MGLDGSFGQLLERVWCPICGAELSVDVVDGKQVLKCRVHGAMKWCLDHDPKVAASVAKHCDSVGIVNLEGA